MEPIILHSDMNNFYATKYGYFSIRRAITLVDSALDLDARKEHTTHPVGFLGTL